MTLGAHELILASSSINIHNTRNSILIMRNKNLSNKQTSLAASSRMAHRSTVASLLMNRPEQLPERLRPVSYTHLTLPTTPYV